MRYPSPPTRRLLELARGQDEPDPAAIERVGNAIDAKIADGASPSEPARVVRGMSGAAKSLRVAGVVSVLAGAGWVALRVSRAPESPHAERPPAPLVVASAPPAPLVTEGPASTAGRQPGNTPAFRKPARAKVQRGFSGAPVENVAVEDELHEETAALRLAQEALRDGSPDRALSLLAEQDVRFRDGRLGEERAAARVLALCQSSRVEEARAQALRFERMWPHSALRARVRSACSAP